MTKKPFFGLQPKYWFWIENHWLWTGPETKWRRPHWCKGITGGLFIIISIKNIVSNMLSLTHFWRSTKLSEVDFVDAKMPTLILIIRMIRNVIIRSFIHILYRAPLNSLLQSWYHASLQALLQICGQNYYNSP